MCLERKCLSTCCRVQRKYQVYSSHTWHFTYAAFTPRWHSKDLLLFQTEIQDLLYLFILVVAKPWLLPFDGTWVMLIPSTLTELTAQEPIILQKPRLCLPWQVKGGKTRLFHQNNLVPKWREKDHWTLLGSAWPDLSIHDAFASRSPNKGDLRKRFFPNNFVKLTRSAVSCNDDDDTWLRSIFSFLKPLWESAGLADWCPRKWDGVGWPQHEGLAERNENTSDRFFFSNTDKKFEASLNNRSGLDLNFDLDFEFLQPTVWSRNCETKIKYEWDGKIFSRKKNQTFSNFLTFFSSSLSRNFQFFCNQILFLYRWSSLQQQQTWIRFDTPLD